MSSSEYIIRGGADGRARLRVLSEVFGASTRALLTEVGLPAGAVCLDAGCGGGDVTTELARMAGPGGRALGVDRDPVQLAMARREAGDAGLVNVAYVQAEITAWEPEEQFDVIYARFLLSHLSEPGPVVAALRRRLRPGGAFIVEDVDFRGHFAEPASPALDCYVDLYTQAARRRGADPWIGPRLPGLLRAGGFDQIGVKVFHPVALRDGIKTLTCVTLDNIADAVLAGGLAGEDEFRQIADELYAFAGDPATVMGGPRTFQVWGRNPGGAESS